MKVRKVLWTVLLGAAMAVPALAQDHGLFAPSLQKAGDRSGEIGVTRSRAVEVDFEMLAASASKTGGPSELRLELFPDASFTAVRDRVAFETEKSVSWIGHLAGHSGSHVALVAGGGVLAGTVTLPDAAYRIRYTPAGVHVVEQVNLAAFPDEAEPIKPDVEEAPPLAKARPRRDDGSTLDLMVLYTPAARAAAGGKAGVENLIALGVTETNVAYANSGIVPRVRLVRMEEIYYGESTEDILVDLQRLQNPKDRQIDKVHRLRNQHQADLVMLVGESTAGGCGIAFVMRNGGTATFQSFAFSYVARQCISPTYSFAHELGHNMGSQHASDDSFTGEGAFPYSYGYKDPGFVFRTVMATGCACPRVLHFSNPQISFQGRVTGTELQDNAQSINNVRNFVANFRVSPRPRR